MTQFTKKEIKNTFLKLLEKMPLSQITVKLLVAECKINRNSFYYHYQDIPALIEEIVREEADDIMKEYTTIDSIETCIKAILAFASMKRKAILHIYNSINRDIFEQHLWKICDYVIDEYMNPIFDRSMLKGFDRKVVLKFYKCECFGFAIDWLNNGMEEDTEAGIERFCELNKMFFGQFVNN
ncbi:MAG: TetR/AcrR family transcriptional regulator C-terminal domain-containing protein [Lachnospiraceae bacterium]|nr:TetR/AcrR family transcriptional regulator C-terminal domain-containing protein [Lachnospiraceae bacterium]